jgi:hypothetical protein
MGIRNLICFTSRSMVSGPTSCTGCILNLYEGYWWEVRIKAIRERQRNGPTVSAKTARGILHLNRRRISSHTPFVLATRLKYTTARGL